MDVEEQYQNLAIQEVFDEIVKKYSGNDFRTTNVRYWTKCSN